MNAFTELPEVEVLTPRLDTPRTTLRFLGQDEAGLALDYFSKNRKHLSRTMPAFGPDFFELDYWRRRLSQSLAEFEEGSSCRFFILPRSLELVIGTISFTQISGTEHRACVLGYGIDWEYEGRGLMTECLGQAIGFAFEELGIHEIDANYMPCNAASGRVLKKLGFRKIGIVRQELFIDGEWRDHEGMRLTKDQWVRESRRDRLDDFVQPMKS